MKTMMIGIRNIRRSMCLSRNRIDGQVEQAIMIKQ